MNTKNSFFLAFLFCLQTLCCFGQSDQWVNCLSHRQVNQLIEYNNLIYAATTGGLIIYNPTTGEIINLNRGNANIPSNDIKAIEIDIDSTIWLMTDLGLCSYQDGNWTEYLELNGKITLDERGQINVATNSTYYYWKENTFDSLTSAFPDLNILELQDIKVDKVSGNIWLSASAAFAPARIFRHTNGTWMDTGLSPFTYGVYNLSFDSNNELWCISDRQLFKYDDEWLLKTELIEIKERYYFTSLGHDSQGSTYLSYTSTDIPDSNYIYKIDFDENVERFSIDRTDFKQNFNPTFIKTSTDNSTIYLGSTNYGCLTYSNESWSILPIEINTFSSNYMQLYKTENNGIFLKSTPYINYGHHVIHNYRDKDWQNLSASFPFKNAHRFRISFSDGPGQELWMNLNDTLYNNIQGDWMKSTFPDIIQNVDESISQVYFDHEDRQWLIHRKSNFLMYESASGWKVFKEDQHGLSNSNYFSIFNHPITQELWVSGYKGIAIYNYISDQWRFLSFNALGLPQSYLAIHISPNQDLIATVGQSIIRLNNETTVDTIASLSGYPELEKFFSTLVEQDTIWLGMKGGIAKYYDNSFEILDRTNSGIVNGYINTMARDENGNLWFSGSTGGLAIYNPDGLSDEFQNKDFIDQIDNEEGNLAFEIFPSPFDDMLNLKLPTETTLAQVNIYNQYGQLVYTKTPIIHNETLATHPFLTGIYFVEILDLKSKKRGVQKCIKK